MSQPNPYNRAFSFRNWQSTRPAEPLPGLQVDEELNRIKQVTDQIRTSIAHIQRDDFALAGHSVGFDQLRPEVLIGINPPSAWSTAKNYVARDTVFTNSNFYICLESHVSGVFADDLADGKWELIASFEAATSAGSVTFDDTTAGLGANLVQTAIEALKANADALQTTVAGLDATQIAYDDTGRANVVSEDVQGAVDDLDAALQTIRPALHEPGDLKLTARAIAPAGWLFCNGAAVSRTTYAALFDAIGTAFGAGDGSTTFNLPDYRGRVPAGKDNMGGTSANRLTLVGGVDGTALGAAGGSQTHTLTVAQMPSHTHSNGSLVAASHSHSLSVPTRAGFWSGSSSDGNRVSEGNPSGGATSLSITTGVSGGLDITGNTSPAGSGAAHPNIQPTQICNILIKT